MSSSLDFRSAHPEGVTGALRLFLIAATVALAAGLSQTAMAAPHDGPGEHGMAMGMEGGPGMGMHRGGHRGRQMEHMLRSVNASAEQRAQIKQILQASQAQGQPLRVAGRKLHQEGLALFAQTTVDARAVEALRQQKLALHDQASKLRMQVMLDVSRVLTPEQRKTFTDRMSQRHAMMERHRAEREGVERAPR